MGRTALLPDGPPGREQLLDPGHLRQLIDQRMAVEAPADPDEPEGLAVPGVDLALVRALPPLEQIVVLATFWGSLTVPQVARATKLKYATVKGATLRAQKFLRQSMAGRGVNGAGR